MLYVSGRPALVTLDYFIDMSRIYKEDKRMMNENSFSQFRLSYYPHKLEVFKDMLREAFGEKATYMIYGDFKNLDEIETPNFYIHVVEKSNRMLMR